VDRSSPVAAPFALRSAENERDTFGPGTSFRNSITFQLRQAGAVVSTSVPSPPVQWRSINPHFRWTLAKRFRTKWSHEPQVSPFGPVPGVAA
jgi:hypothetical protein